MEKGSIWSGVCWGRWDEERGEEEGRQREVKRSSAVSVPTAIGERRSSVAFKHYENTDLPSMSLQIIIMKPSSAATNNLL